MRRPNPALIRMPNDPALLNSLAVLYAGKPRFDDALRLLFNAVKVSPNDPLSRLNPGVCLEAKGDWNGAIAAYKRSLVLQPDSARARDDLERLSRKHL